MKILFYESRPEWGGAQKCELELMVGLDSYGIESIFVTSTEGPMVDRVRSLGKEVSMIPVHPKIDQIRKEQVEGGLLSKAALGFYMLPHFVNIIKLILRTKPDIIYTSQLRSQLLIGWVGKLLRTKVVWHIHGEERLEHPIGKIAVNTADHIIVVSKKICETYTEMFSKSKFIAIPNGVEVNERKRENPSDAINLIMVGAIIEGKRQDAAIRACKELINRGFKVHLHIVGEKPHWHSDQYKDELYRLVNNLELKSNITFHGWVENPDKLLAQSDVFLLPSDTEGLPLSIIEAMGVGIPCIASDVGGVSELITHEETGLLIEKDSLEELVESITRLICDKELRDRMGKSSLLKYEQRYTKHAFLEGVASALRTIS